MPGWVQSPPPQKQQPSFQQRARNAAQDINLGYKAYNAVRNWNDARTGAIAGSSGGRPVMTAPDAGGGGGYSGGYPGQGMPVPAAGAPPATASVGGGGGAVGAEAAGAGEAVGAASELASVAEFIPIPV